MVETRDKKDLPPSPQPSEREIPLDTRLLSDAVIELNISRKNVGIYPPGHIQITKSIDRAYELLQKLFEIREEMALGVAKDTLLVGQDYLDKKNPVYRDFALSLNQQGIAAITFIRGMDKEELVRFHRILTTKPDDIIAAGGIATVMSDASISHIRVVEIDYRSFHLTEEREILKPAKEYEKSGAGMWQDFVSLLSSGSLAAPGQGVSLKDAAQIDPAELARLLNERKLDSNAALQSYDHIISEHMRSTAEKKQLTKEQSSTLAKLNTLVKDLHPELRKQFLSVAFQQVAPHASQPGAEDLLGGFSDDLVIEMLGQANAEGREISPTLTGLMHKLTSVRETAPTGPRADRETPPRPQGAPAASAPPISPEHMRKLFERETYEQYVTSDYDTMLKQLSEGQPTAGMIGGEKFPVEEHTTSLDDQHLDFQIGRAVLAFMEENIDLEDYREFAKKLLAIAPDLLTSGNFALLLDAVETLRRHEREKKDEGIRAVALDSQKIFSDPAFIAKAVAAFDAWAKTKGREAAGFLLSVGPDTVPGLFDLYAVDEAPGGRRILFDLLCNFGQAAVKEAQKRLRDPRAYYVRNLVMLIRWTGSPAVVPHVKALLQHPDQKVRMEVMAALLRFRDPGAAPLLRETLQSKDPDVVSQAVSLAGQYRVADVTDDLVSLFKKVILFDTDYTVNEELVRALGEIGDSRAIPELEKLARAAWTLYPASLSRMKVALYESLGRYPKERIAGLIKIGEQSNDDRIKRLCRKLADRK